MLKKDISGFWLLPGSYTLVSREQEMWSVLFNPSVCAGKELSHSASLLPFFHNHINFMCFISSHLLNECHHGSIGKKFIFLHHPFKTFCFQFLSLISQLNSQLFSCFSSCSFMNSCQICFQDAGILWLVFLWCFVVWYFFFHTCPPSPPRHLLPLPHYKHKHLQRALENNTVLAREQIKWPNVWYLCSCQLFLFEFRCW